jgi:hypothetical protein
MFWSAQFCTEVAHLTRFELVTFAFGGQTPTNPAVHRRPPTEIEGLGWYLDEPLPKIGSEILFSGGAQTVGFGLGRSKMLYLSRGID